MPMDPQRRLILTGTDPRDPRGGIGFAMQGFEAALEEAGLLARTVPTYHPQARARTWLPAARAIRPLLQAIRDVEASGLSPVVYAHAGSHASILRESMLLRLARRAGAQTMLQIHATQIKAALERPVGRRLLGRAMRRVDRVCALSPYWATLLREQAGVPDVAVVPNPLPPDAELRARGPRPDRPTEGPLRALVLTRLVPGKGAELAIEALHSCPHPVRLDIAGEGPLREQLEARVRASGLEDRVRFLGWVSGKAKQDLLERTDVLVAPTTYDALPMTFLEAACYDIPVLALRWGPVPDLVLHEQTGLLADGPAASALGLQLARLAEPGLRSKLGTAARQLALDRYARSAVGDAVLGALPGG